MQKDLNEDQVKLAKLMSWMSEEGYSAGWMNTLEVDLWEIVNGANRRYGSYDVTQHDIDQLKSLSQKCGCWIIFDDVIDERAIDLNTWEKMYSDQRKS